MSPDQLASQLLDIRDRLAKLEKPLLQLQIDVGVLKERTEHLKESDAEIKATARRSGGTAGGVWGALGGILGGFLAGLVGLK